MRRSRPSTPKATRRPPKARKLARAWTAAAARAVGDRDRLIRDVVANAKVFQGGGSEVLLTSLDERIKTATDARSFGMFPRFKDADSAAWEAVIKRAREGADHPFQPTGHTDATEKHRGLPAGHPPSEPASRDRTCARRWAARRSAGRAMPWMPR